MRPKLGLMPKSPHWLAGPLTDPPESVAREKSHRPQETGKQLSTNVESFIVIV